MSNGDKPAELQTEKRPPITPNADYRAHMAILFDMGTMADGIFPISLSYSDLWPVTPKYRVVSYWQFSDFFRCCDLVVSLVSFDFHAGLKIATSDNPFICKLFSIFSGYFQGNYSRLQAISRRWQKDKFIRAVFI